MSIIATEIQKNSQDWEIINEAFNSTISPLHVTVNNLHIDNIYLINNDKTDSVTFDEYMEPKLLWHGTSIKNVDKVIEKGLKIPEGNGNGLLFGPGIYLTNIASKAIQYSEMSEGVVLLCETYLGNYIRTTITKNDWNKNDNIDSVWAIGNRYPSLIKDLYGCKINTGPIINEGISIRSSLKFDEFVVFKKERVKIRYIIFYSE